MIHGENSTVIHYEVRKNNRPEVPKNLQLEIRPLIAFRDYHRTTHENGVINPRVQERSGLASVTPYQGLPTLHLAHNAIELQRRASGIATLNMTPSANAGSMVRRPLQSVRAMFRSALAPPGIDHRLHRAA
jgi:hypothetical protein